MLIYLQLFWEFFKTGLFSVGGGLATLPFLYEIGKRTGWFTASDVADMIAVSESTPGPLGINMATYVGNKTAGIPGGLVATLGLIAPAIIIICLISMILAKFKESELVKRIFYGLRPASTGLIAAAGLGVAKIALLDLPRFEETGSAADLFNWKLILLFAVVLAAFRKFKKIHPIVFILASAAAGIVFGL